MTERARSHDRIGAAFDRLLDRLDQLAERGVLARLDDREAAALDLRRVVDDLAAARLDDPLQRPRLVRVLEPEQLRGPEDLATVERRDLDPLQPLVRGGLQELEPLAVRHEPEEVLHLHGAAVWRHTDRSEVRVHALAERVVSLEHEVGLTQVQRADVADRHERVGARRLRVRQDARIQVEVVVRLRLVDVAGAAARDRLEVDQLEPDLRRERLRRGVELLRRQRGEAALVVRDLLHVVSSSSSSSSRRWWSSLASAPSPWTMPS